VSIARFIWPILLSLVAVAQQQTTTAPPSLQSWRISGVVVNAATGEPLARAEVRIGRSQQQADLQSVVTGRDGRFLFEGLPRGKYWLSAQRRGFPRQAFEQHGNFFTAIAVGPNLVSENLVFRVQPHASISGMIVDEAGEPVRDANVMLFRNDVETGVRGIVMREQAQTDDRGMYHFNRVSPGTYYIAVSATPWYAEHSTDEAQPVSDSTPVAYRGLPRRKPNPALDVAYPVTYYSGATDSSGATPIPVRIGDRVTADLTLMPVPAVHLRVSMPDRATVTNNAVVTNLQRSLLLSQPIFGTFEAPVSGQQTLLPSGEMEISGIPPGRFEMRMQTFGPTPSSKTEQVDVGGDAQIDPPATPSIPITISGTVTLNGGSLPRAGFIRIWKRGSGNALSGQVSSKGDFEFQQDHLNPGNYEVGVFGISGAVVRTIAATGARVTGQSLEIQNGGTIRLKIDLAAGLGEISGTALRDGKPVSGAMIVLVPENFQNNGSLIRRDQSDSDGTFTLRAVLPGKYTVLALENAWDLEWLNPSVLMPYLPGGTPLEVTAHQKYDIKVKAQ
jgi:hypothetical protein